MTGASRGRPAPGPSPRPPLPSPSCWASRMPGRVPAPRHPALSPGSLPALRVRCTPGPWGGCGEPGRVQWGPLRPTAQHPKCTNSTALPTSHWVLSGPFCLCSPAPHPRADPPSAPADLGSIPYLFPHGSRLSLWVAAWLRKSSVQDGVEVEAAMGRGREGVSGVPGELLQAPPPQTRQGAGLQDGRRRQCTHAPIPLSFCKCGKTRVRARTAGRGRQQRNQRVIRSSHTLPAPAHGCSTPGARLLTSTLTPGCTWPHTPPCSPNVASRIQHPKASLLHHSQNLAATHTPARGSGLQRGAASCGVADLTLEVWISMDETHAFNPPPQGVTPFLCISSLRSPMS